MLEIINDILDFSKIEADKIDFESINFSLCDSMADTMKTLAMRAHKKGLELAYHIRSDVPDTLVGDPGRLRQIIVNLVDNAIKFTEQGEVVVRLEVESHLPASACPSGADRCAEHADRQTSVRCTSTCAAARQAGRQADRVVGFRSLFQGQIVASQKKT